MTEWIVASGFLSGETKYRLVIDGPYDSATVCRLIEILTLQKRWLAEALPGEPELASWAATTAGKGETG